MSRKKGGVIKTPGAAILAAASAVGKQEHEGPLGSCFDYFDPTDRFGVKTWEKAESEMQRIAFAGAMGKFGVTETDIDALFAGDLLNQCVGSAYGLLDFDVPYFGLYGACSTAAEGLALAAMAVSGGMLGRAAAVTSSHNAAAERQYRSPLEYGGQRPPTAQWTVTGAGAFIVGGVSGKAAALIADVMPGVVVEKGIKDAANMGAAMAPAAADTILRYLDATGRRPDDFDLIVTGDLGFEGNSILADLLTVSGVDVSRPGLLNDCGMMIFDRQAPSRARRYPRWRTLSTSYHRREVLRDGTASRTLACLCRRRGILRDSADPYRQNKAHPGAHTCCVCRCRSDTRYGRRVRAAG